jgi:hypothetical protein
VKLSAKLWKFRTKPPNINPTPVKKSEIARKKMSFLAFDCLTSLHKMKDVMISMLPMIEREDETRVAGRVCNDLL